MSRHEDSDDGVMPLNFSDSDWERLSYDEESQLPSLDPDLEAGSGELDNEEDIAPCDEDPDDEPEDLTAPYDADEDATTEDIVSTDHCDSGVLSERGVPQSYRDHSLFSGNAPAHRKIGTNLLLGVFYVIHDFFEPRTQWFFDSNLYQKYLADNAILSSALVTAIVVMCLPLAVALSMSALLVACSAVACAILVVVLLAVGAVLSLVWAFWVSVPISVLLAALFAGSTLYQKTFRVKLSAKEI